MAKKKKATPKSVARSKPKAKRRTITELFPQEPGRKPVTRIHGALLGERKRPDPGKPSRAREREQVHHGNTSIIFRSVSGQDEQLITDLKSMMKEATASGAVVACIRDYKKLRKRLDVLDSKFVKIREQAAVIVKALKQRDQAEEVLTFTVTLWEELPREVQVHQMETGTAMRIPFSEEDIEWMNASLDPKKRFIEPV